MGERLRNLAFDDPRFFIDGDVVRPRPAQVDPLSDPLPALRVVGGSDLDRLAAPTKLPWGGRHHVQNLAMQKCVVVDLEAERQKRRPNWR